MFQLKSTWSKLSPHCHCAEAGTRRCTYQVGIRGVGVVLWEGDVDSQGHAIGKDGQQDEDVEGPQVDTVKDPGRVASEYDISLGPSPPSADSTLR